MKNILLLIFLSVLLSAAGSARAQAVNAKDIESRTNSDDATTGLATIAKSADGIIMYPNPAYNELNILFDANAGIKNIIVYNLIGKAITVYKVVNNSARLNVENVPAGIYFIRLTDAQGQVIATRRFTHQ